MYYVIWKKIIGPDIQNVLKLVSKNELLYCGGSPFEAIEIAAKNPGAVTSIAQTEAEMKIYCEFNQITLPEPEVQSQSVEPELQNEFFIELEELKQAGLETVTQITESVFNGLEQLGIKEPASEFFKNIQTGGEEAVAKAKLLGIKGATATGDVLLNLGNFLKKLG